MPSITSILCEPLYSGAGAGVEEAGGSVSGSGSGSVSGVVVSGDGVSGAVVS